MDKFVNISIYAIYMIIAIISIIASFRVSIVMCFVVVAIEYIRLLAIYKSVYKVVILVFIMNTFLIGYNSYQSENLVKQANQNIENQNKILSQYITTKDLRANTLKDLTSQLQTIKQVQVQWYLLIGVYLFLEISLMILVKEIHKQDKRISKSKTTKVVKNKDKELSVKPTPKETIQKVKPNEEEQQEKAGEKLEYVGSYREYAQNNKTTIRKAEEIFKKWKEENKLIKQNGKNHLRG